MPEKFCPASAFLLSVNCVSPASASRQQGRPVLMLIDFYILTYADNKVVRSPGCRSTRPEIGNLNVFFQQ
jgi:hypothetical protein